MFSNPNSVDKIIDLMNDKYKLIHFVFLVEKSIIIIIIIIILVKRSCLSEIKLRNIIDNLEIIINYKPFYFTYLLNPILVLTY